MISKLGWAIGGALALAVVFASCSVARGSSQSSVREVKVGTQEARFPAVSGSNLERRKYQLPADFEGELNIVALAFLREHQDLVDTWTPTAKRLTGANRALHFYELPTLTKTNGLFSGFIDGGMRAGIPDKSAREATITLYIDRADFLKALKLPTDRTIYVLLVDRRGKVHWRGEGAFTPAQGAALEQAILAVK
jgi:ATP10 protein